MKIKVKTKPGDCQSPAGGMLATVLFVGFGLGLAGGCLWEMEGAFSLERFMDVMSKDGVMFLGGIFFLLIGLYFLKLLVSPPKPYRASVKGIGTGDYKGKEVTWIGLSVEKDKEKVSYIRSEYRVYVPGEVSGLEEGKVCVIGVKEFNWQVKYILTDGFQEGVNAGARQTMKTVTLKPVLWGFYLIFGGTAFLGLVNLFLHFKDGVSCLNNLPAILIGTAVCVLAVYAENRWNADNRLQPDFEELQKKQGQLERMDVLEESMQPLEEAKRDNGYFETYGLTICSRINAEEVRSFKVVRCKKAVEADYYAVASERGELVYRIQPENLDGLRYEVFDTDGRRIAKIRKVLTTATFEYVVSIVGRTPFSVRKRMQMTGNYELVGVPFMVSGEYHAMENDIRSERGACVARLGRSYYRDSAWMEEGTSEVTLADGCSNSAELILVCLCVTMGNWAEHRQITSK